MLISAATTAVGVAVDLGRDRSVVYCEDVARMLSSRRPGGLAPRIQSIIGLAEELDIRDTGTAGHCHTVGRYAELMARGLGFEEDHVERVRLGGRRARHRQDGRVGSPDEQVRAARP